MTTGLYQYIREQAHRNDLVGSLGKTMLANPGVRPDHSSLAFRFAAREFEENGGWTKMGAIERLNNNVDFQKILKIEPRLSPIISELINEKVQTGYHHGRKYLEYKKKIEVLVGWMADKEELNNHTFYEITLRVIEDLLPINVSRAYEGEEFEIYQFDL